MTFAKLGYPHGLLETSLQASICGLKHRWAGTGTHLAGLKLEILERTCCAIWCVTSPWMRHPKTDDKELGNRNPV